jgi:hypothetical protein
VSVAPPAAKENAAVLSPLSLSGSSYEEVKDPCVVEDRGTWHMYGTGIVAPNAFEILHATAPSLGGPWLLRDPVRTPGLRGTCLAAPGIVVDDGTFHMFLQTEYNLLDGRIEHLVSGDGGRSFSYQDTAMVSLPGGREAGIYDPHPAEIAGERYLVYSAFGVVGEPDIFLARSAGESWNGPWERQGPILVHEQVPFHNARGREGYEWGLEGAQLLELPDGRVLLNAVCFLADGAPGSRQRVFFAIAATPDGPYELLGPVLDSSPTEASGENGHATAVIDGDELALFIQQRDSAASSWNLALNRIPLP